MQKTKRAIAKAIGKNIAKKRIEKKLTQEIVAEKLNIGNEAVSRIERGTAIPNIVRLIEFAEIFECETDELLVGVSKRPIDYASHLQKLFDSLEEKDQVLLFEIMSSLATRLQKTNE